MNMRKKILQKRVIRSKPSANVLGARIRTLVQDPQIDSLSRHAATLQSVITSLFFLLTAISGTTALAESEQSPVNAKSDTDRQVLDPSQFKNARFEPDVSPAYAAAKACPEIMEKLFCYCGCDLTEKHSSLLSCFVVDHGAYCPECKDEAIMAEKMHKDGRSITEIQKAIDLEFAKQYPFENDTPAYAKYKSARLWDKQSSSSTDKPTNSRKSVSQTEKQDPASKNPKLKPGRKIGNCCNGKHDKQPSN
jgi:hypothetical protein